MAGIWDFIHSRLSDGQPVMLMVVTDTHGSSPGKKGFKMAVSADGQRHGSIGGGLMEYKMVELAMDKLAGASTDVFTRRLVHDAKAGKDASGLICAGEQSQVFVPLFPHERDRLRELLEWLRGGRELFLGISQAGWGFQPYDPNDPAQAAPAEKGQEAEHGHYTEILRPFDTVYIFGGGHISLPLSQVCRMLDFRVVVLDDRPGLDSLAANSFAHEKRLIDYRDAAKAIKHPPTSHVLIMTVSHASDQQILSQMLGRGLAYLGMIGSKSKVRTIFEQLEAAGATKEQLEKVHAPIGIKIFSETPGEIAVSIAAQLIKEKNGGRAS